jgi:hypothetical protein
VTERVSNRSIENDTTGMSVGRLQGGVLDCKSAKTWSAMIERARRLARLRHCLRLFNNGRSGETTQRASSCLFGLEAL